MKSSKGWTLMVLYSFNSWTQIVHVSVLRQIRLINQKNFGKPKVAAHNSDRIGVSRPPLFIYWSILQELTIRYGWCEFSENINVSSQIHNVGKNMSFSRIKLKIVMKSTLPSLKLKWCHCGGL